MNAGQRATTAHPGAAFPNDRMSYPTLGQLLRSYREAIPGPPTSANGYLPSQTCASQMAIALKAGITTGCLNKIESDLRPTPRRETLLRITAALELGPRETDRVLVAAGLFPFPELEGDRLWEMLRIGRHLVELSQPNVRARCVS